MATTLMTDAYEVTQTVPLVSPEPVQCPGEKKNKKIKVPEVPYMTRMFLKGEPVALGTVQIMIGIIMMAMGAITWFTQILYSEISLGLGLSFIFSGSVTLGAHKGTYPPLIKSALALNIISALLAMSGICYFCFAFTVQPDLKTCNTSEYDHTYHECEYKVESLQELIHGIKGILLILCVLELCVCTTTIVFSCKAKAFGNKMGKCSSHAALLNIQEA
ncbi:hypothetical protein KOW79_000637 [Hemibagrus wyckioides]|uniref:Membrane-spanning 4-domains subfamily A member 4A-like n=1 Tax=Hemibagrus wyckioides TaxID=337641 RepID=A0A9D3SYA9_9TELE|nr:membrane-spanning 4-domains subfamily A member 15-like [Hemibagrus wyckioides]KAG7335944.1 hypothetical protein KOW79_000637 [Hemibagrus wyckioides]